MLGYTQPYPIPDKSNATPFITNSYICYLPSQNKMMPRHDCTWNETEATALSNPEPNTSNLSDGVTTFAPTAKYRSWCIILQLAAMFGWIIEGIDVELAFLESDIDKLILMTLPKDVYRNPITGKPIIV
jgi:hypothetical protein